MMSTRETEDVEKSRNILHGQNEIAADKHGGSSHHMIIWKDREGLAKQAGDLSENNLFAMEDLDENEALVFQKFMKAHNCYDLIPTSSKLLVFDTQLSVEKAFYALIYNGLRAAPLWDSGERCFVGMLTITDFIKILKKYYKSSQGITNELESHKISTWREVLQEYMRPMVTINPELSLFDAVRTLCSSKVHRLPVIDLETGNVLYIMTHKRILRFLYLYIHNLPKPDFMSKTLEELNIGTHKNVITVTKETTLIDAINLFVEKRISALPVVDENGELVDVYAKFDVINLAVDKSYSDLEATVGDAIDARKERPLGIQSCTKAETFGDVMERIVKAEVHRLMIVDDDNKLKGILSLSDILQFIVLQPPTTTTNETLVTTDL